jgi:tetratricopeptide (TPR) repeat protein
MPYIFNNMAKVLQQRGRYDEAMEMYQKALGVTISAFGREHGEVGTTYAKMASVLHQQGRLEEAISMYKKALAVTVPALGATHSSVCDTYDKMAIVLRQQANLRELWESGTEHQSVAIMYGARFPTEIYTRGCNCFPQANRRVTNDIPLGCPLFLLVHYVNCA